jgi:hypothetical protein
MHHLLVTIRLVHHQGNRTPLIPQALEMGMTSIGTWSLGLIPHRPAPHRLRINGLPLKMKSVKHTLLAIHKSAKIG